MVYIPDELHEPINSALTKNVCLVGTVQSDGWVQISPRGSVIVYDRETLAYWAWSGGKINKNIENGTKVTVFFRDSDLRNLLPKGGIARFYGRAAIPTETHASDFVWSNIPQAERDRDPDKKGRAVLIELDRVEDLSGDQLSF